MLTEVPGQTYENREARNAHHVQPSRSPTDGWDFPKLGIRGLQNFLKLRTRHHFNNRLTADLGVDINALNQAIIPRAALSYQVHRHLSDHVPMLDSTP